MISNTWEKNFFILVILKLIDDSFNTNHIICLGDILNRNVYLNIIKEVSSLGSQTQQCTSGPHLRCTLKWTTMIAWLCIVFKTTVKDIHTIQHWLSWRLVISLIQLLCCPKWTSQTRQLSEVEFTMAPVIQDNVRDFRGRLEDFFVLLATLEARPGIPFFPPFMFAPSWD